jgi:RimJ/RimL family protein N-acetyltransferase
MFSADERDVFGEAGIYPRSAVGRVPYGDADRVELGYWLRADVTGRGLVTEATRALLGVASTLPHLSHVEIRCDARNAPSAAVPQRLGFVLATTIVAPATLSEHPPVELQVWTSPLPVMVARA